VTASACDNPPSHIERRDRNGGSGRGQAAAPRRRSSAGEASDFLAASMMLAIKELVSTL
jgi:hypothetical protein